MGTVVKLSDRVYTWKPIYNIGSMQIFMKDTGELSITINHNVIRIDTVNSVLLMETLKKAYERFGVK